jgi:hypothetical protein
MRRVLVSGLGVIIGGALVGATLFPEQVAQAAQAIMQVRVVNTGAAQAVPVSQQGTANVNVTNSSLSIVLPPVTGGGGRVIVSAGPPITLSRPETATAIQIEFASTSGNAVTFRYQGELVGRIEQLPDATITELIPLTRSIRFDELECEGTPPLQNCLVHWFGAVP